MAQAARLELTLLPGARELLAAHARALPQRDDLCGAFCGSLALAAARVEPEAGQPLDQDAVALAAGSVVSRIADQGVLPHGEAGRRDYRVAIPLIDDGERSGTTAGGLQRALERLSAGTLAAIPYEGPWTAATVAGLFDLLAASPQPATLVANLATRHLWGSHASVAQMLDHLQLGGLTGPEPDWDVGHFSCVVARADGERGALYAIADTYPSLGSGGVHVQPGELLARALERKGMAPGGMLAVVAAAERGRVRDGARSIGLHEGTWDNGTLSREAAA